VVMLEDAVDKETSTLGSSVYWLGYFVTCVECT
jgi:hypothetical protein